MLPWLPNSSLPTETRSPRLRSTPRVPVLDIPTPESSSFARARRDAAGGLVAGVGISRTGTRGARGSRWGEQKGSPRGVELPRELAPQPLPRRGGRDSPARGAVLPARDPAPHLGSAWGGRLPRRGVELPALAPHALPSAAAQLDDIVMIACRGRARDLRGMAVPTCKREIARPRTKAAAQSVRGSRIDRRAAQSALMLRELLQAQERCVETL